MWGKIAFPPRALAILSRAVSPAMALLKVNNNYMYINNSVSWKGNEKKNHAILIGVYLKLSSSSPMSSVELHSSSSSTLKTNLTAVSTIIGNNNTW